MAIETWGATRLESAAMAQWKAAVAAGCPDEVTSSWRDPALQRAIFLENYTKDYATSAKYDRRPWLGVNYWRRKANARTGGATVSVAVPGTSEHEVGRAMDLGSNARVWMRENGQPYGWVWPKWAQQAATYEDWHYEFMEDEVALTPEQDAALSAIYKWTQGPGTESAARVMGFLRQRYDVAGKPATTLDSLDGAYIVARIAGVEAALAAITSGADLAAITAAIDKSVKDALGDIRLVVEG